MSIGATYPTHKLLKGCASDKGYHDEDDNKGHYLSLILAYPFNEMHNFTFSQKPSLLVHL